MTEFRPALPGELPQVRTLWARCFHDDPEFIGGFLSHFSAPEQLPVLAVDGEVRSMCCLLPAALDLNGAEHPAAYVYAMSTDPDFQGQGYGLRFLAQLRDYARGLGYHLITLMPADEGLFRFYEKGGYETAFRCRHLAAQTDDLPIPEGRVTAVGPETYCALRRRLLNGLPALHYDRHFAQFQHKDAQSAGGGLYAIEMPGGMGCAVVCRDGENLRLKELIAPPALEPMAMAVLASALDAKYVTARAPVWPETGSGDPFGMALWLTEQHEHMDRAFLGLALD